MKTYISAGVAIEEPQFGNIQLERTRDFLLQSVSAFFTSHCLACLAV